MKVIFRKKTEHLLLQQKQVLDQEVQDAILFIHDMEEQRWDKLSRHQPKDSSPLFDALIRMSEKFAHYTSAEKEQMWIAENVARFSMLIRNGQQDMNQLTDVVLKEIVKCVGANQGAIFVLENNGEETLLEMKAAYAYERKKFLEKSVRPGQGLVGQCFLEGEKAYLTQVPRGYVHITSGLGEATPRCLLLLPLRVNDVVIGVLELASFSTFTSTQFSFLDKVIENVASAFVNAKESARMKVLLEQSEKMRYELTSREEEIRKNFEDLKVLQEDQIRKQFELEKANQEIEQQKEEIVKIQKREAELMESKLATQQMLSDRVITKLKSRMEELQAKLKSQEQFSAKMAIV
jgi:GAF domain-containing protein